MTADPSFPPRLGTSEPVVTARALGKTYGSGPTARTVLADVHLEIRPGSFTAIIGPSGSGKSTLLCCLAGLESAARGAVELLGVDPARCRAGRMSRLYRREIGFVFQDYQLVPYLDARRNAALPGLLDRRRDALAAADEALGALGLSDHASTPAARLSGGQQQRVALARVLAGRPSVVFADEPTGALDRASSAVVLEELRARADAGAAVVLVTHDPEAAARADRIVALRDGRVQSEHGRSTALDLAVHMAEEGR